VPPAKTGAERDDTEFSLLSRVSSVRSSGTDSTNDDASAPEQIC